MSSIFSWPDATRFMKTGTNTFDLKRDNLLPLHQERLKMLRLSGPAREELAGEVEAVLREEPLSVVRSKRLAPSGDPHDYVSLAAYFWPDPDKADGLPWIMRDGEVNPERDEGDCIPWFRTCTVVRLLCLGHALLGDSRCLPRAEEWLRRWFLDPATRMNPHMDYSQYVPGLADGHCWGLIDSTLLPGMLDAVVLVEGDLDAGLMRGLRDWVAAYADWFTESRLGQEAAAFHNNHASWHLAQSAAYLCFAGEADRARDRLRQRAEALVEAHIAADGSQPHELERSLSFMYSCYNLLAHCSVAVYAQRLGVDYRPATWTRLLAACEFLEPAASGEPWAWPQIKPLDPTALLPAMAWLGRLAQQPRLLERARALAPACGWGHSYRRELLGI